MRATKDEYPDQPSEDRSASADNNVPATGAGQTEGGGLSAFVMA